MNAPLLLGRSALDRGLRVSLVFLLLSLFVELLFLFVVDLNDELATTASLSNMEVLEPGEMRSKNNYDEVVERALFSPDRKPVAVVQQQQGASLSKGRVSEHWLLAGVVISGDSNYAIFGEKEGERHIKLEEGMSLDQWQLNSVTAKQVILTKDGEEDTLDLLVSVPKEKVRRPVRRSSRAISPAANPLGMPVPPTIIGQPQQAPGNIRQQR